MKSLFERATVVFSCIAALTMLLLFTSCKKDMKDSTSVPANEIPNLTAKTNTTVSGFVTDENNAPVTGASVKAGNSTTVTNQYEYFQVKEKDVTRDDAVVT